MFRRFKSLRDVYAFNLSHYLSNSSEKFIQCKPIKDLLE